MRPDPSRLASRRAIPHLSRRTLLRIGGLGTFGLSWPGILRAENRPVASGGPVELFHPPPSKIRSCILIFYYGGPSHLDTWDMKPAAPREVRGPVSVDRDQRARASRRRAHAACRAGHGPAGDPARHAPSHDQPQRRGVHGPLRPRPAERGSRTAGQRSQ